MPRGGIRPGQGRKPGFGPYGEPTQVIRVPVSRVGEIKAYLQKPKRPFWPSEIEWLGAASLATPAALPLFEGSVPAGFPSPAEDYAEGTLDLNAYLVEHEAATFYVRVTGESMRDAGILSGDLIAVDRALEARHGDIVLAVLDGQLTVKELYQQPDAVRLLPHNPDYAPILIQPGQELQIWGVVKGVVRKLK
ncbi:MAG: translesion error-prone DNA polymerase V autoproteolytic subunit [Betaproteobacteria bacterium]|nr:translesion error-prone DNA polymerase V autoproteolytic subunit [Betaproteobacteria bacterium]